MNDIMRVDRFYVQHTVYLIKTIMGGSFVIAIRATYV